MEKTIKTIQSVKQNGEIVQNYIRDLSTWENEMKRKEAALKAEAKQELPPVRSRVRRDKYLKNKKKNQKNPAKSNTWEGGDSNKASEEMDMSEVGPLSLTLDGKQSEHIKQIKNREEAQQQKERGNKFVKVERWDDAIACYNRAIQLVKDDAIYYANRGLCYLKKESLHQAEADCTEALRLDPTYVKALQRRATAREKLGSLRAASSDLSEVLKLEPHNVAAKKQLDSIKQRMGTKGRKAKSSPQQPTNPIVSSAQPKTIQPTPNATTPDTPKPKAFSQNSLSRTSQLLQEKHLATLSRNIQGSNDGVDDWRDGVGEDILVIKPVKKPPHLRSKRALKTIPIKEIPLGKTSPIEEQPKRMMIEEIDPTEDPKAEIDLQAQGDSAIESKPIKEELAEAINEKDVEIEQNHITVSEKQEKEIINERSKNEKERDERSKNEKERALLMNLHNDVESARQLPANSVQFMAAWRMLSGDARSDYLTLLEPNRIPKVFANALESDVLSEMIGVLHQYKGKFAPRLNAYLKELSRVKRFSALVMFLSAADKQLLEELLVHCETTENCSDADIAELKKKFEL